MIIENGISHEKFACGALDREKHFVFVKGFLSVWLVSQREMVTFLQENYFIIDLLWLGHRPCCSCMRKVCFTLVQFRSVIGTNCNENCDMCH